MDPKNRRGGDAHGEIGEDLAIEVLRGRRRGRARAFRGVEGRGSATMFAERMPEMKRL